jgi:uncharacterized membrane protein YsdA (DUF1294 family)
MAAVLMAVGFLLAVTAAVLMQRVPLPLLWIYVGASALAALLYTLDKRAAIAGRRRIRERTLHGVALAGGWPGALAAQSLLRHKTAKPAFRRIFWLSVLLNCAALGFFLFR